MPDEGIVIIVSGPAGAGKGSVVNRVISTAQAHGLKLYLSVSMTSRAMSGQETEGASYFFVDEARFEQAIKKGELLEYNNYNGRYYGTPRKNVEEHLKLGEDVILEIDVNGGKQILKRMPNAVRVFIMPPSMEELEHRLRLRGRDSDEDIVRRLEKARVEIPISKEYDHVIINDTLEEAAARLIDIIKAEKKKASEKIKQRGSNNMQIKKTMDDIITLCDNRYALVNIIAKRAREISEDSEAKKQPLLEKPVNIVIGNLLSGKSAIAKKDVPTSFYKEENFEISIMAGEDTLDASSGQ